MALGAGNAGTFAITGRIDRLDFGSHMSPLPHWPTLAGRRVMASPGRRVQAGYCEPIFAGSVERVCCSPCSLPPTLNNAPAPPPRGGVSYCWRSSWSSRCRRTRLALGEMHQSARARGSGDKPAGSLLQPEFLLPKSLNPRRLDRRVFYTSRQCFVPRAGTTQNSGGTKPFSAPAKTSGNRRWIPTEHQ